MTRGNNVFAKAVMAPVLPAVQPGVADTFLYALFMRIALTDGSTIEFETVYDSDSNTIELLLPTKVLPILDQITGMQRGPNFKTFIDWLIGSKTLVTSPVTGFISASELRVWTGAKPFNFTGKYLTLTLPVSLQSVLGYNEKTDADCSGITIYMSWLYITGANSDFAIRASVNVIDPAGVTSQFYSSDTIISTQGMNPGDVRETLVMNMDTPVLAGSIVGILLTRNYFNTPDPATEAVAVIGIRVKLDAGN